MVAFQSHRLLFVGAILLTFLQAASGSASSDKPNIASAYWLDSYPEAKCLDGSPALYYMRNATSSSNRTKWVMHIQGGGWCSSPADCLLRSTSRLGSSKLKYNNNATMDLGDIEGCDNNRWCGALMVNDEITNPLSHDWNAVFFYYCDGASWIGNQAEVSDNGLYYRGWHNLNAVLADLFIKHGLDQATEVIIGGDSAGGLATFYHIDYLRTIIHEKAGTDCRVLGMPDSGYWPDDSSRFTSTFTSMLSMQNGSVGLPKSCLNAYDNNETACLFPQNFANLIETPLFPLQSIYDPLQKGNHPEAHGVWLSSEMNRTILSKSENGAWVHSCERHCGAELLTIDGMHVPEAVTEFFFNDFDLDTTRQRAWLQIQPYPCKECCNDDGHKKNQV